MSTPSFGADDGTDTSRTVLKDLQHFVLQQGAVRIRYVVPIAPDGAAGFGFSREQQGRLEQAARFQHRNLGKSGQDLTVASLLKGAGIKGSGDMRMGGLSGAGAGSGYRYSLRGQRDHRVCLPGPGGVQASSSPYAGLQPAARPARTGLLIAPSSTAQSPDTWSIRPRRRPSPAAC